MSLVTVHRYGSLYRTLDGSFSICHYVTVLGSPLPWQRVERFPIRGKWTGCQDIVFCVSFGVDTRVLEILDHLIRWFWTGFRSFWRRRVWVVGNNGCLLYTDVQLIRKCRYPSGDSRSLLERDRYDEWAYRRLRSRSVWGQELVFFPLILRVSLVDWPGLSLEILVSESPMSVNIFCLDPLNRSKNGIRFGERRKEYIVIGFFEDSSSTRTVLYTKSNRQRV